METRFDFGWIRTKPEKDEMWRTMVHLDAGHSFQHGEPVSKAFCEAQHYAALKSMTDELGSLPDAQNPRTPE